LTPDKDVSNRYDFVISPSRDGDSIAHGKAVRECNVLLLTFLSDDDSVEIGKGFFNFTDGNPYKGGILTISGDFLYNKKLCTNVFQAYPNIPPPCIQPCSPPRYYNNFCN
jgi:hypothetical protein